nr:uncharacterized protein LOC126528928 isoform X1 [Dermacentor andersoni]
MASSEIRLLHRSMTATRPTGVNHFGWKGSPNTAFSGGSAGAPELLGDGYETENLPGIYTGSMPRLHPEMPGGPYGIPVDLQPFHQLHPLDLYALGHALLRATSGRVQNRGPVYGDSLYGVPSGNHWNPVMLEASEDEDLSVKGQGRPNSRRKRSTEQWGGDESPSRRHGRKGRKGRKGRRGRRPAFEQAPFGQTTSDGNLMLGRLHHCPGKNAIKLKLPVTLKK